MPPPPVDARATPGAEESPDPFKEADLLNGANKSESRRRSGSLFKRITGSGRERRPESPVPALGSSVSEDMVKPDEKKQNEPEYEPQQSQLVGVSPEDRVQSPEGDDDLLEIPAFLRRQAN